MANFTGNGAPTKHTVGAVGDIYTNNNNGKQYKCVTVIAIDHSDDPPTYEYEWDLLHSKSEGADGNTSDLSGASSIVDVIELPTENIKENTMYRLLTAKFIYNREILESNFVCYVVNELPENPVPVTNADMTDTIAYYNTSDNIVYGYVDAALSEYSGGEVPIGWYSLDVLAQLFEVDWSGIISYLDDDPCDGCIRLLLTYDYYVYKNEWMRLALGYESKPIFDISWDGEIGDRFALDMTPLGMDGVTMVKVSDEVLTYDQLHSSKYIRSDGSVVNNIGGDLLDTTQYPGAVTVGSMIVSVYDAETLNTALGLPEGTITNGVYFPYITYEDSPDVNYIARLVGRTKFVDIEKQFIKNAFINLLDEYLDYIQLNCVKYMPQNGIGEFGKQSVRSNIDVYSTTEVDNLISTAIGDAIGGSY